MQSGKPASLHFINTTHPKDAITRGSISQIRSHVAKEIRSRARKSYKAVLLNKTRGLERLEQNTEGKEGDIPPPFATFSSRDQEDVEPQEPLLALPPPPSPVQAMSLSHVTSFWSPIRPFSDKENFLLDHYLNYIIPFGNGSCHKNESSSREELIGIQLNYWIPLALSDLGLIAALFLQSCRSLEALNTCQSYSNMTTEYRLQCIQSTNASLSTAAMQITDATIAKVMIMASDEFTHGSFDGWALHLAAIAQMVDMRGGVDALGVGGFLKEIIVNTPICYGY